MGPEARREGRPGEARHEPKRQENHDEESAPHHQLLRSEEPLQAAKRSQLRQNVLQRDCKKGYEKSVQRIPIHSKKCQEKGKKPVHCGSLHGKTAEENGHELNRKVHPEETADS